MVKQVFFNLDKIEGRPGGALEAAWNTFEGAFDTVWEMERDFFATSGIVTNERCGNPEVNESFYVFVELNR